MVFCRTYIFYSVEIAAICIWPILSVCLMAWEKGLRAGAQRFINPWNATDHEYSQPQTTGQPKWVHLFGGYLQDIRQLTDAAEI